MSAAGKETVSQPSGRQWLPVLLIVLLVLAVAATLATVLGLLGNLKSEALEIDVAGRQRMLNERLVAQVLLASQGEQADFATPERLMHETARVLETGGPIQIHGRSIQLRPAPTEEIVSKLKQQTEVMNRQKGARERLLALAMVDVGYPEALAEFRAVSDELAAELDEGVELFAEWARAESTAASNWTLASASLVLLLAFILLAQVLRTRKLYRQLGRSEERLELAFAGSSDGVWDWNILDDSTHYSARFKELLGFSEAEFPATANAIRARLHPDDHERVYGAYERHFQGQEPFDQECRLERKDGTYGFFRVRGRAVWGANSRPIRMVGAITDIGPQKEAEELLATQAMEAKLVHRATTMASETDSIEEALQSCVDIVCEITGWPVGHVYIPAPDNSELIPTDIWHLSSEEKYEAFFEVTQQTPFAYGRGLPGRIWQSGEPAWIVNVQKDPNFPRAKLCKELEVKGAFGFPIQVGGHLAAVLEFFADDEMDPDPKILRTVSTVGEQVGRVLERKLSREELRKARDAAEEASRSKSQFLANMSHELRTPLNSIIGFSNILLRGAAKKLQPKDRSFLDRIHANGLHLLSLINEVLDISKIEAGKMELESESVDVGDVVEEVIGELHGASSDRDLRLEAEVPATLAPILADRARLKQVLINLVGNAIKFTDTGSVTVRVETAPQSEYPVRLSVADTGIGVSDEQLETIFDSFRQADGTTTRKYSGTGLGLTISRSLCRLMGFELIAQSEVGVGSTFTVLFEGTRAARPGPDLDTDALLAIASKHSVLVIDDDPDTRLLLSELLTEMGCEVFTAESGEAGLEAARDWKPQLITLDLMMPGMSGWEVLHRLKSDPELTEIPVVVVSIVASENRGTLLGALDVVSKPIRRDDLKLVLKRVFDEPIRRAMVVEDNSDSRRLLVELLAEEGIQTIEAENGAEALDLLDHADPDLVLLDLMMPVMDGIEFLSRIRQDRRYLDLPVIVVTAKHLTRREMATLETHGAPVLPKGEKLDKLLKKAIAQQFVT